MGLETDTNGNIRSCSTSTVCLTKKLRRTNGQYWLKYSCDILTKKSIRHQIIEYRDCKMDRAPTPTPTPTPTPAMPKNKNETISTLSNGEADDNVNNDKNNNSNKNDNTNESDAEMVQKHSAEFCCDSDAFCNLRLIPDKSMIDLQDFKSSLSNNGNTGISNN